MLIEPTGLLDGQAARDAVDRGAARWLAGGPLAFTRIRVGAAFLGISDAPEVYSAPRPPWAGLPTDRPLVMGVLNVTPDSFSDPGRYFDRTLAIAAGQKMFADGADIVDVGAESTRPGAQPLDPAFEQERLLPVVRALAPLALRHRLRRDPLDDADASVRVERGLQDVLAA